MFWPGRNFISLILLLLLLLLSSSSSSSLALQPSACYGLLVHEVSWSHTTVGRLWTSDQLVAEISTLQHTTYTTNIHAPAGIRPHDRSRRAAIGLRLRPRGHWDRNQPYVGAYNVIYKHITVLKTVSMYNSGCSSGHLYANGRSPPAARSVLGLLPLASWDCVFESHRGRECLLWVLYIVS
jgi:hypothetical protein